MHDYTICPMPPDKEEETRALMARCFDQSLAGIFFLHPESTLVVLHEGKVVAGLNADVFPVKPGVKIGYLGWLYTDENHRGKHLAGLLLQEAIVFLRNLGCTDLCACVEGDNPASFKQLHMAGFRMIRLLGQLKRFGFATAKVWKHASRFFDMGYFLWYLRLDGKQPAEHPKNLTAFILGSLANTFLVLPLAFGWNLPALAGVSVRPQLLWVPFASLLIRTLAMWMVATLRNVKVVYYQWDTSYLSALLLPFLLGLPFPVPGNMYIEGCNWSPKAECSTLGAMAFVSNLCLALFSIFVPNPYTLMLLVLDTFGFFYPFCGFNASRLKRAGMMVWLSAVVLILACLIVVLIY